MHMLVIFFRAYPWQSVAVLVALLLAGVVEGLSLSALLPLLNIAIGSQAASEASPAASGGAADLTAFVFETLNGVGIEPTVGALLAIIVIGIAVKSGLVLLAKKQVGYTVARVATDLRLALLRALLSTRWQYYLNQPIGVLANSISSESTRAALAYFNCTSVIALVIQTTAYVGVALLVSWQTTVIFLITGIVVLYFLRHLVEKSRRAGKRQTKVLKSLSARLVDTLQSVKPLKAMAREELADKVLAIETIRINRALQKEVLSTGILAAVQEPTFALVGAFGVFVALTYLDVPIATVMVLVVLLGRGLDMMGKVQRRYQKMASLESAYQSIMKTIEAAQGEREAWDGDQEPSLRKAIRFDHVAFGYDEKEVLKDLSLEIPANSLTTLVGPSGAGKTTLVDLVTGMLRPTRGAIFIDDVALERLDLRKWRRLIGYVPQENLLLHDSVLHNVTLDDPELDEADAERALRAAGAWSFIEGLTDGMHTVVGERGTRLSGGQRQRIMVARALAHRPRLLILDEATSALDPASEAAICATIEALRSELTIIAISHQPAMVDAADRVFRLTPKGVISCLEPVTKTSAAAGE